LYLHNRGCVRLCSFIHILLVAEQGVLFTFYIQGVLKLKK